MVNFNSLMKICGGGRLYRSVVVAITAIVALVSMEANAQSITVTGTVKDVNGPIVGATVIQKGSTTNGVATDLEGRYSIAVPTSAELVFESLGYESQTISVGAKTIINVVLQESATKIEEVVATAYGTQKKVSIVGAIQSVEPGALEIGGSTDRLSNNLAGQIAGVIAYKPSGEPGYDSSSFWIRGISSYQGVTSPLVLVDGIERTLDDLDVEQIESFSVLKDASASAMYGVRGANGVIVITTKRGKVGKPRVSIRVEQALQAPTKLPEFASAAEDMELQNELFAEVNPGRTVWDPMIIERTRTGYDPDLYPDVNWLDAVTTGMQESTRATVNVNGGSDRVRYSFVATYFREKGIMAVDESLPFDTGTKLNKFTVRSNVDVNITKSTVLGISIGGYMQHLRKSAASTDSVFGYAFETPSYVHPTIYSDGTIPVRSQRVNPWAEATQMGYTRDNAFKIETLVTLDQKLDMITEGLSVNAKFSFDNYQSKYSNRTKGIRYYEVATGRDDYGNLIHNLRSSGDEFLGHGSGGAFGNNRTYVEASVHYNRIFGGKHNVDALVLYMQDGYDSGDVQPFRHQGISGRLSYNFDNRYVAEFNFGYNGSENFAKGQRFGFFPSAAIGWIISEEPWMSNVKGVLSTLKLRASLGLAGNDNIGGSRRFAYMTTINANNGSYTWGHEGSSYGRTGVTEGHSGVGGLTWETVRKANVGLEIGLWNELNLQLDVFDEYRSDIFIQRGNSVPTQIGFINTPYDNYGIVDNKGFEVALTWNHRFSRDFQMQLRGTASYAKNWIRERDEAESLKGTHRSATNRSVNEHTGYIALRLYEDADFINGALNPDLPVPELGLDVQPGDIMYADLNEDGKITAMDITYLGHTTAPRFVYGFGGNFVYKNLDFGFFMQGVADAYKVIGGNSYFMPGSGQGVFGNVYANYQDRWTQENPSQDVFWPRLHYANSSHNTQGSTWWLKDMSFLRLKNIEIGYSLPKEWCEKIHLNNLRFYVGGYDLFTISGFKMWDPEIDTTTGLRYPTMKSVQLGIDLNF